MSDAIVFGLVFVGLMAARFVFATLFFIWVLPDDDRCPMCDAITSRLRSPFWNRLFPWLRTSWCMECGWEGLLRVGPRRRDSVPRPSPKGGRASLKWSG